MTEIQGPKNAFFGIMNALGIQKDPIGWVREFVYDYDDIAHFKLGPQYNVYLVSSPEYVRELLVKHHNKLIKWERQAHALQKMCGGPGVATAHGETWRTQRKLIAPAFHTQRIKNYIDLMVSHTLNSLEQWEDGSVRDLHHDMTVLTMGIIGEVLFNIKDIEADAAELTDALNILAEMFILEANSLAHVPDWVPTPRNQREDAAMAYSQDFINKIVLERRKTGEDTGDVMSALLHAVDEEDGSQLTNQEVLSNLLGLFIAGHETTALAMTWTLYMLAKHPDVQEKVHQEVVAKMAGDAPTLDELEAMTYTDQVVKEAMRVYPPAYSLFFRVATEDINLGEHTIPQDGVVFISPYVMHHNPKYWDNPESFDPSRFDGDYKDERPAYSYMPFGGGARVCVASHMAEMEIEVILSAIVKNYKIELQSPDQVVKEKPVFTLQPDGGMPLVVRKR